MSVTPHLKGTSSRKNRLLTVLDIGSSKTTCLIARLRPHHQALHLYGRNHSTEILGYGIQRSQGVKSGAIIDMALAERSIRQAVHDAEKMAGLVVDSVIVNFAAGKLQSSKIESSINVRDKKINMHDVKTVLSQCSKQAFDLDQYIVHSLPINFSLDQKIGISDPIDMMGKSLGAQMHIVTAQKAPVINLEYCINRAHLSVETMVVSSYASALATLVGDEPRLGATCIDIGAGSTAISIFADNRFVYTDSLPIGAHHITLDIARGFSIPVEEAERIKVLHGTCLSVNSDDNQMISIASLGEDHGLNGQYPRSFLTRIIRARVEEILEMVRERLDRAVLENFAGKRIILTGGGSQLPGLVEVSRQFLKGQIRLGRPLGISGLPAQAKGAAFSCAVGLLIYPQLSGLDEFKIEPASLINDNGSRHFFNVGQWLRRSF